MAMLIQDAFALLADHATRYVFFSDACRQLPRDGQAEHEALMKAVLHGSEMMQPGFWSSAILGRCR